MDNFRIYTEGKGDVKFLKDFIAEVYQRELEESKFDTLGSWSGYKIGGALNTSIQQNFDTGNETILILDADNDYQSRKEEVLNDFVGFNIPIHLFLFPDNAQKGNKETMLAEIAVERKIMDCFLEYEKCVDGHPKPLNDARIYSYLDMLLFPNPINVDGDDLRKDKFINYRIRQHWNLNHKYLNPLKLFLDSIL